MNKSIFIIFTLLLIELSLCTQLIQYQIYKSYLNDPHNSRKINLGILQIRKNLEYNEIQTNIKPNFPELVSENDVKQTSVILTFVPKNIKNLEQDNKIFKTSVVQKLSGSQDQIIALIVGVDMKVKAINYMEKRSPLREIRSDLIKMQQGKQQFTKMQMAPKKPGETAPQDESFFAKYKWPIIIGMVLLYVTSNGGGKTNPQGGAPQGR